MSEHGRKPFIVLGVTGGIAAYKAVEICRLLVDAGCHVAPVLTKDACRFIGPLTFSALASEPAQTELYDASSPIPHTRLGQSADLVVVAPATAHLLARLSHGLADDLLTNTLLATRAPVLLAPAMHTEMWEHAAVRANVSTLTARGVEMVGPESGRLAGGDEGAGRMAAPETIVARALAIVDRGRSRGDLNGLRVAVSAGGTREAIDPVRFLTNRSSGKQGHALAAAAAARGAQVTLVTTASAPVEEPPGPGAISVVRVESAAEMLTAMRAASKDADVVVMAAAVADFRPVVAADSKIKRSKGIPSLTLEPTEDILATLVEERSEGQIIVGFAAETHDVLDNAQSKLERKGCDLLVVNDVSAPSVGFDHDTNEVTILDRDGTASMVELRSKRAVADAVFDRVIVHLPSTGGTRVR